MPLMGAGQGLSVMPISNVNGECMPLPNPSWIGNSTRKKKVKTRRKKKQEEEEEKEEEKDKKKK